MSTLLGTIIADFSTTLASGTAIGATSLTLNSATDSDGVALPSGRYFFTIDNGTSSKEHISCQLSGTALTSIKHVSRQGVETSGMNLAHRLGASIQITDFAHILQINSLLSGATNLNSSVPLGYDGAPTISTGNQLATKTYVDGVAIAGAPNMDTTTKGIGEEATAAEINAGTQTGGTSAELIVNPKYLKDSEYYTFRPTTGQKDALAGDNTDIAVGSSNKYVTQTGLQHNAEKYAADAGASDTYVITLSPVPTSYTNGMVVYFKANTANTGAATLNVNSLGAKTIVKGVSTTLADGDIAAGMFCTVIYDGTNFVLQNPIANNITQNFIGVFKNGIISGSYSNGSTISITHSLGYIPKRILLNAVCGSGSATGHVVLHSNGSWDANGQSSVGITISGGTTNNKSSSSSAALIIGGQDGGSGLATATGVIGNVTSTGFDIVLTASFFAGTAIDIYFNWSVEA